ncbi:PREDICTED: endocuticle structural protein SgAbd-6-like [Drosophila arizonae]|uniref:Endocuticle structural protein SgAbd-6-like n=1 Tax=Drosophila arizonae TaxID=7263 RepID=A0ABM1P6X8_DROAR|nr:PREDICTED: endocuticle structural protein SgAbd-6-like [Drosophila arizonae]
MVKMMLVAALLLLAAASCSARPQNDVEVVEYESDNIGIGGYKFSYKLSDGTTRTEEAVINNAGTENESLSVRGSVSWVAPDGQTYTINFVADENGFQPEGAHLPK